MSLETRLAALISAVGADIKSLFTRALPAGGSAGQVLEKTSGSDYAVSWADRIKAAQTYSPSSGGTATLNLALSNEHRITMPAGNVTIALSNATEARHFMITITQDGTGGRTVTWFSTIRWAGGTPPTLTTGGGKRDVFGFTRTGANTFDGFVIGKDI